MVVVTIRPEHHELLAHEEGRRAVTQLFGHLWQRHADRPYAIFYGPGHISTVAMAPDWELAAYVTFRYRTEPFTMVVLGAGVCSTTVPMLADGLLAGCSITVQPLVCASERALETGPLT